MTTDSVCREYLKESNHMLMSGIMVAIAVEHCDLHKRISLRVLLAIGTSPRRLMLGFMVTTCFLSMWISNTATTAMMVPIVDAVLTEIEGSGLAEAAEHGGDDKDSGSSVGEAEDGLPLREVKKGGADDGKQQQQQDGAVVRGRPSQTRLMMFLAVAYGANTGGTGTITGTGTNLVFKGIVTDISPDNPINFASWMVYNVPAMIINLVSHYSNNQLAILLFLFSQKNSTNKAAVLDVAPVLVHRPA